MIQRRWEIRLATLKRNGTVVRSCHIKYVWIKVMGNVPLAMQQRIAKEHGGDMLVLDPKNQSRVVPANSPEFEVEV